MNISGAQLIIDFLEQRGVDIVAGMLGGALLPHAKRAAPRPRSAMCSPGTSKRPDSSPRVWRDCPAAPESASSPPVRA